MAENTEKAGTLVDRLRKQAERIAALEAENARLTSALVELIQAWDASDDNKLRAREIDKARAALGSAK